MNEKTLEWYLNRARPADEQAAQACRKSWDSVAKPLNSLGLLEAAVCRVAAAQRRAPKLDRRRLIVACADNGVVAEGVTQTGSEVTRQVAASIARGGSSVCAMARVARCEVVCVDAGMNQPLSDARVLDRRAGAGTGNIALGPAMTREQARFTLTTGIELACQAKDEGCDILLTGEMGIGNTTTSATLLCRMLDLRPETAVGRGAGLDDAGLKRKIAVVRRALDICAAPKDDPVGTLSALGGFDIGCLAGVFIGGAVCGLPVVIDGLISAAAALVAARVCPPCAAYMLASHVSRESAAAAALDALGLRAPICADMALGEGSGAVALLPLLDMALGVLNTSAHFDAIGVEAYKPL